MEPEAERRPTAADWADRVRQELGGRDPVEALSSQRPGEPPVRPLYTTEDLPRRAWRRLRRSPGEPRIAVRPEGDSPADLNASILAELAGGASAVRLPRAALRDVETLDRCLEGALHDAIAWSLEGVGASGLAAAAMLCAWLGRRGATPSDLRIGLGADPLGTLAAEGSLPRAVESHLRELAELAAACDRTLAGWRAVEVHGAPYHGAGASDADELGAVLAATVTYLRAMESADLPPERALGQIGWSLAQGRDVFVQIAKLRAARRLRDRLAAAVGVGDPAPLALHAGGSSRTLARYDRWVNIVRGTTQAAAALLGGADEVTVEPFDAPLGRPSDPARRLARNTVHVLGRESALAAIGDPAGGSYYLERLTDELARSAWDAMREIEREGGLAAALLSGSLQERLADRAAERRDAVARRDQPIVGVSEYAVAGEDPPASTDLDGAPAAGAAAADRRTDREEGSTDSRPAVGGGEGDREAEPAPARDAAERAAGTPALASGRLDAATEAAAAGASLPELERRLADGSPGARCSPLPSLRDAEPFERLRDLAGAAAARPRVFLANLGPQRRHRGRALFAAGVLAAGGIDVVEGDGTQTGDADAAAEAVAEAFRRSGLSAACLCGDDELYTEAGEAAVRSLREAGATRVWAAAPPGETAEGLLAAGVDGVIHGGGDLVVWLHGVLEGLGVEGEGEK